MQLNRYVLDNFQRDASISIFSHSFLLPLLYILRNAGDFVIFFFSSCMLIKKKRRWVMQLSHSYSSSRSTDYKTWILTCLIILQFVSNCALTKTWTYGGCRLQDLSIRQVIDHVTSYKFECSHWWKIYFFKKILHTICSPVWIL